MQKRYLGLILLISAAMLGISLYDFTPDQEIQTYVNFCNLMLPFYDRNWKDF